MPFHRSGTGAAASVVGMPDNERDDAEDEFRDMLREFLSGNGEIDPSRLAGPPDCRTIPRSSRS